MPLIREVLSAEQLVQAVRVYRMGKRTERFSIKTFTEETGIPESQSFGICSGRTVHGRLTGSEGRP